MTTTQEQFWQSEFGDNYIDRNTFSPEELDRLYEERYGTSRRAMFEELLGNRQIETILEVGCNNGNQLAALAIWQPNLKLTGLEINHRAATAARARLPAANIVEASALTLPFASNEFDLVFTAGVLIHIHPNDHQQVMSEIVRVSKKYIWGLEYYAPNLVPINYRGNTDRLWKMDFAKRYQEFSPDLKLVKEARYAYQDGSGNSDSSFLLEKS